MGASGIGMTAARRIGSRNRRSDASTGGTNSMATPGVTGWFKPPCETWVGAYWLSGSARPRIWTIWLSESRRFSDRPDDSRPPSQPYRQTPSWDADSINRPAEGVRPRLRVLPIGSGFPALEVTARRCPTPTAGVADPAVPVRLQKPTHEERVNPALAVSTYRSSQPSGLGRRRYRQGLVLCPTILHVSDLHRTAGLWAASCI